LDLDTKEKMKSVMLPLGLSENSKINVLI